MIHPVPWRTCMGCGRSIADTEAAEYDEREGAYYCGCPGSERMESTPVAHCDWGNHDVGAHLVHPVGDDETACTACIQDDHMAREEERHMMTVEKIRMRLERIRWEAEAEHDKEAAHGLEDDLWSDVLRAIAAGACEDPKACAEEALKTSTIEFARHCA